jgi:hypothetical protein
MKNIPDISSDTAIETGFGFLFVENKQAQFIMLNWPQAALEDLLQGLKAFDLYAERNGSAVLRGLPAANDYPRTIVLAAGCVQWAGLLNPATRLTRLSLWAHDHDGQRLIGEYPVRLHRDEVRLQTTDLGEALRLLCPETVTPSQWDAENLPALYPFLPSGARYHVQDGEITIEYPPLTPAMQKELDRQFHWATQSITPKNLATVLRDLKRVLILDPTYLKAREQLAVAKVLAGDSTGARTELHQLLLLAPDNVSAWKKLAGINQGRNPAQSETYLQRAAVLEAALTGGAPAPVNALVGMYEFTRDEVAAMDFRHFLSLYGRDRVPSGPCLAALQGAVTLVVGGYDDDPRELWEIPEVRRFFQALLKAWPYAPYFCDLGNGSMISMFQSCLNSIMTRRVDGFGGASVTYDPHELVRLLEQTMGACRELWTRAELPIPAVGERFKAVFEYFNRS